MKTNKRKWVGLGWPHHTGLRPSCYRNRPGRPGLAGAPPPELHNSGRLPHTTLDFDLGTKTKSKTRGVFLYLPFVVEWPEMAGKTPEVAGVGCAYTRLRFRPITSKNHELTPIKPQSRKNQGQKERIRGLPNRKIQKSAGVPFRVFRRVHRNEREREQDEMMKGDGLPRAGRWVRACVHGAEKRERSER
ncbi:hypothetical protein EV1_005937 [Malus domestica]